uniref:Uncharacterized protein n=1 Tax=Triticum urartu TaxID=4572 RepID=A0A8R7P1E3_TRIUA
MRGITSSIRSFIRTLTRKASIMNSLSYVLLMLKDYTILLLVLVTMSYLSLQYPCLGHATGTGSLTREGTSFS